MNKKYILYVIIFLIIGELIHQYYKSFKSIYTTTTRTINQTTINQSTINQKEEFTNYNELPTLTDLSKSYPRRINSIAYKPDTDIQPITISTIVPTLTTGKFPTLGFYGNNSYASKIPINIIRHSILPIEYKRYETSKEVCDNLELEEIELGLFRDYDIISRLRTNGQTKQEMIIPMYYETMYFLTSKELKDLPHFQNVNLEGKPIKLFTTSNDKPLLDKIIKICNIDTTKLEIYAFKSMEDASMNFILNPESIIFICCHFKNGILQKLLNELECLVLPFIPNRDSLIAIGGYNQRNPVNDEKLRALIEYKMKELKYEFNNVYSSIVNQNLTKNILYHRNDKQVYKTIKLRTSLYIGHLDIFTEKQLSMLSKNMIKSYQTMGKELDNWNKIDVLDNNDEDSFNLDEVAVVLKEIKIENTMNNEIRKLGYIN